MPPDALILQIDLLGYWHAGTGRGQGSVADAECNRDDLGLPFLPGRTLKGLLRDATTLWAGAQTPAMAESIVQTLFGGDGFVEDPADAEAEPRAVRDTQEGALAVSSARLPEAELIWFARARHADPALAGQLFDRLSQTAMDERRGVARRGSLRTVEVAVPLRLEAEIGLQHEPHLPEDRTWFGVVEAAVPFLRAAGMARSRGLGRCRCSVRRRRGHA